MSDEKTTHVEGTVHAVDDDGIKRPFAQRAVWRGGAAYTGDGQIVITGSPLTEDPNAEESAHNCDAMGCGQDHVVWRFSIPMPDEIRDALKQHRAEIDELIAKADATVGCHWCGESTPRDDVEALGTHLRTCSKSPLVAELAAVTAERDDLKRTIALNVGLSA